MRKEYAWRSLSLASLFILIGIYVILQMIRIQVSVDGAGIRDVAEGNKGWIETVYPARGEIYDRNGKLPPR